jgi:uncharacterized protein (TIGR00251 family)
MTREHPSGCTLSVRAQSAAKRTAITGIHGLGSSAELKIAVHAPPLEHRANQALIAFLAQTLAIPTTSVTLLTGELSRGKVFLLRGIAPTRLRDSLSAFIHLPGSQPPS